MANTRELSQLASLINIIDQSKSIGVVTEYPNAKVGIGTLVPTSKVDVVGDVNVSGAITATSFYGDGSNITGLSTFSGDYNDLSNKPTIPSDTSDLTNNAGFVTSSIVVGYATEGYVSQQISSLIGGAPETLDTLNELAAALNDDENFATTITNSLVGLASEGYVNNLVSISTFSGNYNDLINKPEIPSVVGLASEGYVDSAVSGVSTFSGNYNDLTNKPSIPSIVGLASEGYVNVAVANLVDSAPSTLDTLNELASALGDDANFSTTVTNSLANKADLSGATFTGIVTATSFSGDGSNLSNIISGIGINSNGVIIGTGITTLNFLGTGTTISISGDIANISVSTPSIETSPGKESYSFVASEGQTSFSVSYSVGYIDVYLNGIRLSSDEFTASDGLSVILNTGASSGDVLDVIQYTMGKGNTGDPGPSGPLEVESTTSNNTYNPVFALGTGTTTAYTNSNLSYNPSTGALTASSFIGDGSGLTGAGSTVADDTSTNETFYPIFTQTTSGTITATKVSTINLSFNPFTGNLSAVDFNSTSDRNLKENIRIIDNPIEKVIQISGVTFDWKSSKHSSAGVIAQEVEKILPQIVNETDGNKSVNYNGLIGLLVEVVKQQQEQINTLSNRIETLEERI